MIGKSKAEIKAVSVVNKVFLLVLNVETLNTGWWFFFARKKEEHVFCGPSGFCASFEGNTSTVWQLPINEIGLEELLMLFRYKTGSEPLRIFKKGAKTWQLCFVLFVTKVIAIL